MKVIDHDRVAVGSAAMDMRMVWRQVRMRMFEGSGIVPRPKQEVAPAPQMDAAPRDVRRHRGRDALTVETGSDVVVCIPADVDVTRAAALIRAMRGVS